MALPDPNTLAHTQRRDLAALCVQHRIPVRASDTATDLRQRIAAVKAEEARLAREEAAAEAAVEFAARLRLPATTADNPTKDLFHAALWGMANLVSDLPTNDLACAVRRVLPRLAAHLAGDERVSRDTAQAALADLKRAFEKHEADCLEASERIAFCMRNATRCGERHWTASEERRKALTTR